MRWHPEQSERDLKQYQMAFSDMSQLALSNPITEPVFDFMTQIGWLV